MIEEILVKPHPTTGNMEAVVYPTRDAIRTRDYIKLTVSSCVRLERMMRKYETRTYLRKNGISVWIAR